MTPGKQKLTILILFLVFVSIIPVIICYSMGYRISDDFKIVETGGIYLSITESDTSLYINDKLKKKAGLVGRNILVQNLKPGTYKIRLEKENYSPWRKNIKIQEGRLKYVFRFLSLKNLNQLR